MTSNIRRGRGRFLPVLHRASWLCLTAGGLVLSACGSNSSSSATDYGTNFARASAVIGQADFSGSNPNRGGAASGLTLSSPTSSATTNGSLFYVGDSGNNRILGYSGIPSTSGTPASFVLGQPDFATTAPTTTATGLAQPTKVSISNNGAGGQLVVTDSNNNRVLIWNTLPTTTGTPPDVVVGQANLTSNAAGTTASTLTFPSGAMIGNGRLVVVDQNNNRILIWKTVPTANGTAADVVLGQADFTSKIAGYYDNTNNLGLTRLTRPSDVWTDGFKLLVSDTGNNRVLYWQQVPSSNDTPADFIIGQTSVTRTTAGASNILFNAPIGVGSDGTQVYIADTSNNRVLVFPSFPVTTGTAASRVIGQGSFTNTAYNDDHNNSTGNDPQDDITDNPATPTSRTLHTPAGVFARNGSIYVTDRDNHRLLTFAQ